MYLFYEIHSCLLFGTPEFVCVAFQQELCLFLGCKSRLGSDSPKIRLLFFRTRVSSTRNESDFSTGSKWWYGICDSVSVMSNIYLFAFCCEMQTVWKQCILSPLQYNFKLCEDTNDRYYGYSLSFQLFLCRFVTPALIICDSAQVFKWIIWLWTGNWKWNHVE